MKSLQGFLHGSMDEDSCLLEFVSSPPQEIGMAHMMTYHVSSTFLFLLFTFVLFLMVRHVDESQGPSQLHGHDP